MEIKEGEVVVIRDGDYVEGVFYREFYPNIEEFLEEVANFINVKGYENPNISFMKIENGKFKPLSPCDFMTEFNYAKDFFEISSETLCELCGTLNFIYLKTDETYCPSCKLKR